MILQYWLVKNSNPVIKWSIVGLLIVSLIFLIVMSILIKDLKYPSSHPYLFTLETLLISFAMGLIVILMSYGRNSKISIQTLLEFTLMTLKFGVFHILLQFSGFYSYAIVAK